MQKVTYTKLMNYELCILGNVEDAVDNVMRAGIYAESGMGCTGPLLLVSDKNLEKAKQVLKENDII